MSHLTHSAATTIATTAKAASYSTSAGLLLADSFADFMNHNIGLIGGLLGIATWVINWVYKHKELKLKREIMTRAK